MARWKSASRLFPTLALALAAACGSGTSDNSTNQWPTGDDAGTTADGGGDASQAPEGSTADSASAADTGPAGDGSTADVSTPDAAQDSGGSSDSMVGTSDGPSSDGSPPTGSDVVGKVSVGYQGWFTAPNDGSGLNPPWWHYTGDRQLPTPTDISIKSWPDMSDFTNKYTTGFASLGNGAAATLFSSYDASTVDAQLRWMQDTGIDTVAIQRFGDFMDIRDQVSANVRTAAEAHGRKFYIMYDISGWTTFQTDLLTDWNTRIVDKLHLTDSPAYARHNGKPVVCIWGLGFLDRPGDATTSLAVVNSFASLGMYVIGGVPRDWRTADGTRWGKTGFLPVYDALNAISPWMVGVIGNAAGSDSIRQQYDEGDVAYCHSHGLHYQPCVLPGDLSGGQRVHGDFMWHQFANMIQIGSDAIYISMYDEFNEGNQIAKTAATAADKPAGSSFQTLDEDGTACSSDYYLRLTGDGGKMLKGQIALTFTRPTSPQ
jgi:hypothetical protein